MRLPSRQLSLKLLLWIVSAQSMITPRGSVYAQLPTLPEVIDVDDPQAPLLSLDPLLKSVLSQHPSLLARREELVAAREGFEASRGLLDPFLSGQMDLSDDLVTLTNPLEMNARTAITTRRYNVDFRFVQPLRWGTQLSVGIRQGQIETTNPFRNCVPGIISDRCYESSLTLSLSQPLLRGRDSEAVLAPERSASAQVRGAQMALQAEASTLIYQTINAYLQLSLALAQEDLEARELTLTQTQLKETRVRVDAGLVAPSELFALESALAQRAQSTLRASERALEARAQLETLTASQLRGAPQFPREILSAIKVRDLPLKPQLNELDHLPEFGVITSSIAQLEARRAPLIEEGKPQLDLGLIWNQNGLGEELTEALGAIPNNESRLYGVTLSYTQQLSSRVDQQLAQLSAQIKAKYAEREALLRRTQLSWRLAHEGINRGQTLLELALFSAKNAKSSADVARQQLEAGRVTRFEALELQSRSVSAQIQTVLIEHEIAQDVLTLLHLSGRLLPSLNLILNERSLATDASRAEPSP